MSPGIDPFTLELVPGFVIDLDRFQQALLRIPKSQADLFGWVAARAFDLGDDLVCPTGENHAAGAEVGGGLLDSAALIFLSQSRGTAWPRSSFSPSSRTKR